MHFTHIVHVCQLSSLNFPCGSAGKESACNAEDLGSTLGWEDPLEKGKATHSSILAWRIPWTIHETEESQTRLSDLHFHFLSSSPTVCRSLKPYYCLQLLSAFFSSFSCLLDPSWHFIDNFSSFFLWDLPCMFILIKPGVNDYLHFLCGWTVLISYTFIFQDS